MQLREDHGLPVAEADADEAAAVCRSEGLPGAAVLRVISPRPEDWGLLAATGFVRRPVWVTWLAQTPGSDEEYQGRLPRKARQDLRRALVRADGAGLRLVVEQPVRAARLDVFLALYESRIADMAHGFAFAAQLREAILDNERELAVWAFEGDTLVGGVLCQESPREGALKLRFSAVEPRWRAASLARVLYLTAFRAARQLGHPLVTLGNDPNLFGHVAKPGLMLFKSRLGFEPVPAGTVVPAMAGDVADRILSLDRLTDPAVMLAYRGTATAADAQGLAATVFGTRECNLKPYEIDGVDEVRFVALER
jgi:predicted N-acetyltransferase YhbS